MPLPASYDPAQIQEKWTRIWTERGYFHSEPNKNKKPFSVVIPPPNVTGALHLGHALNGTLQDVMIRFKRMQGFETLWMPGADHAGIATQAVVERKLFTEEGKTRHDIGREELVRRIWAWKDEYEQRIIAQLKAMGASCDWPRWRFTLDEGCSKAVRETFFHLFADGFIYRGNRLVNWDTHLQTAVADDEVYHDEVTGSLWHFKYPIEGSDEFVVIATTRPETMLGDTAVAVNPKDERYQHLVGKQVRLPLMDRLIPVIADGQLVDMTFGTGVVKVTPAHDPNDYQCGLRNNLEMINILTPDGKINGNGGKYAGLKIDAARKAVVADLEQLGLVAQVTPHKHNVGHSDRSKTRIEPFLSKQWFVRMAELADKAMDDVRKEKVKIHPPRYADTYLRWLGEKRDWCISRQLWWGHQIPIWSKAVESPESLDEALSIVRSMRFRWPAKWKKVAVQYEMNEELYRSALQGGRAGGSASADVYATVHVSLYDDDKMLIKHLEKNGFARDPDVLDTWFSSALWPHSTMGWPRKTDLMRYYYPTSLLSTAREIITLWVARMVLFAEYNTGKVPFRDVFIHPVIQDGNGMPMKKSAGNGVDPFDIIAKYGADALRYTLAAMTTETQDVRLPVKKEKLDDGKEVNTSEKFEVGRNFGTKIFNAARLILSNLEGYSAGSLDVSILPMEDRWILSRLSRVVRAYTNALETYQFSEAGRLIYDFFWGELCDWYIEMIKPRLRDPESKTSAQRVSAFVLDYCARLLHPLMPFVTEEIWQALAEVAPQRGVTELETPANAVAIAPWPQPIDTCESDEIERQMAMLQDIVRAVRNIRAQFNVNPKADIDTVVDCDAGQDGFLAGSAATIKLLAKVGNLTCVSGAARPPKSAAHVLAGCKVYVPLAEHIDFDAEIAKQQKKLTELSQRLQGVQSKLGNESFVGKAPPQVVEQQRQLQADLEKQIADVQAIVHDLQG